MYFWKKKNNFWNSRTFCFQSKPPLCPTNQVVDQQTKETSKAEDICGAFSEEENTEKEDFQTHVKSTLIFLFSSILLFDIFLPFDLFSWQAFISSLVMKLDFISWQTTKSTLPFAGLQHNIIYLTCVLLVFAINQAKQLVKWTILIPEIQYNFKTIILMFFLNHENIIFFVRYWSPIHKLVLGLAEPNL